MLQQEVVTEIKLDNDNNDRSDINDNNDDNDKNSNDDTNNNNDSNNNFHYIMILITMIVSLLQ